MKFYKPTFKWYDFWIGIYYDKEIDRLYICPIPMILFMIDLNIERPYLKM